MSYIHVYIPNVREKKKKEISAKLINKTRKEKSKREKEIRICHENSMITI